MPNRILRDGILDSDRVDRLSVPAEVFYRRLLSAVDDFGRFDARPVVLRAKLFPLRLDRVADSDVAGWLAECEAAGLIAAYQVDGRPYLVYLRFGQTARAKKSKFPPPPPATIGDPSERSAGVGDAPVTLPHSTCSAHAAQMHHGGRADEPQTRGECARIRIRISNSDFEGSSEPAGPAAEPTAPPAAGQSKASDPPGDPPVLTYPVVGDPAAPSWPLTRTYLAELSAAYPHLDALVECRQALAWVNANPAKKKTARGMKTFLVGWLGRSQNAGRAAGRPPPAGRSASECVDAIDP